MRQKKTKIDSANAEASGLVRSDPLRANKLADWAFKESQGTKYLKGQADALKVFAVLLNGSNPQSGYDFAIKAIEIYDQIGDEYCASSALMIVAKHYQNWGWITRSHYTLVDAYERALRSGHKRIVAAALFNLGVNAEDRGDYKSALDYFVRSKAAAADAQNEQILWQAVCAEQEMHYLLKDGLFNIADSQEAFRHLDTEGHEASLIDLGIFLSKVSRDNGDLRKAKFYLKKSFSLARKVGDDLSQAEILFQLGCHKVVHLQYKAAKKRFEMARRISQAKGLRSVELACVKELACVQDKLGNSAEAFALMCLYVETKEELFSHENEKHLQEMRTLHQVQLAEEESKLLRQKNNELAAVNERLETAFREKESLQKELERLVKTDELTGALNRRELLSIGAEMVARFHSQARPAVVMIVDIDHFKAVNDSFGHSVGDEVLRRFTKSCQRVLRPTDNFGRLGGEEFCVLLDHTKLDIALKVAERIMKSIRSTRVSDLMGDKLITASIGVVEVNRNHKSVEQALHDADLGLYEAKRTGRDRICVTGVKKKKAA